MSQPTEKANEINNMLYRIIGLDRAESISNDICVSCGGVVAEFRDALSKKEYTISGLCQACQDKIFGYDRNVR